jgi:hypothetical protein
MEKLTSKKICRLVAVWDLFLTVPFAVPGIHIRVLQLLSRVHYHLSPDVPFPEFYGLHVFFVQLFGILAVLWAIARICRPDAYLAACDLTGRFVVAAVMVYYVCIGTSLTILAFSASEIGFGLLQAAILIREKRERTVTERSRTGG